MWTFEFTEECGKRQKWFLKKRRRELAAVLDNLDTVKKSLDEGLKPDQISWLGFVHNEPDNVLAIDQKGGGKDLRQTRLYVYLDRGECVIHVITLGDKDTQTDDIDFASRFVQHLLQPKQKTKEPNEQEKTL